MQYAKLRRKRHVLLVVLGTEIATAPGSQGGRQRKGLDVHASLEDSRRGFKQDHYGQAASTKVVR
eukprot:6025548-Amphidinium_carterae.1